MENLPASKAIAACSTGRDGHCSFPYLDPEKLWYGGTRNGMGNNEVHAILRVMPGANRKQIKMYLRQGAWQ